jgi:hypothetical protein
MFRFSVWSVVSAEPGLGSDDLFYERVWLQRSGSQMDHSHLSSDDKKCSYILAAGLRRTTLCCKAANFNP